MFLYARMGLIAILACGTALVRAIPAEGWQFALKRIPVYLLLWFFYLLLSLQHLAGFILDAIIFPDYRQVKLKTPVFILGIPRSGTTFLHRILARDRQFTSCTMWELILAPSICERYFYTTVGKFLSPLQRLFIRTRPAFMDSMDNIHKLDLQEPEEDFVLLIWINYCFLLAFFCPKTAHYWKLSDFDKLVPTKNRLRVMKFYTSCLQKHIFFHGRDKVYLSKNPSFTPFAESIRQAFPDSIIVACHRPPLQAIPSQLSSLIPLMQLLGPGKLSTQVQSQLVTSLYNYYAILHSLPGDTCFIAMQDFKSQLHEIVSMLYSKADMTMSEEYQQYLQQQSAKSNRYQSSHHYSIDEFGLAEHDINLRFADVYPLRVNTTRAC